MINLKKILMPGVLGFYTHFETTEIIAFPPNANPINVFTLIVLEERTKNSVVSKGFLNDKRIKLTSLKNWRFGVFRYVTGINRLPDALSQLNNLSDWTISGNSLGHGSLQRISPLYVAPNSYESVAINSLLKNNFFNGSYICEWFDHKKSTLKLFYEKPHLLQKLSSEVQKYVPIKLASVSDRLGNFMLQLPITVIASEFSQPRDSNDLVVSVGWHPKAQKRALIASAEKVFDDITHDYTSKKMISDKVVLEMSESTAPYRGYIWDEDTELLLFGSRPSSFISSISMNMGLIDHEPRIFSKVKSDSETNFSVQVKKKERDISVGEDRKELSYWTNNRIYKDEKKDLSKKRELRHYSPVSGSKSSRREKAMRDVLYLIRAYGSQGVWLWDPYLSASDIIDTLFFCPYVNSQLRALTSLKIPDDHCEAKNDFETGKKVYLKKQREILDNCNSNYYGLSLEYRGRLDKNAGWAFHDRFIIFPQKEGAIAWSLGTSVNSLGYDHHILQKVSDGQIIADAFLGLWNLLDKPEYLIWKKNVR